MLKLVKKCLQKLNHGSQIEKFESFYQSHPNFPSLLAITDGLQFLNIENVAANVPFEHFDELTDCFLAEINLEKKQFYLLSKSEGKIVLENEEGKVVSINKEDLEKKWTGIVLLIEENVNSKETDLFKKTELIFPFFMLVILLLSVVGNSENKINLFFLAVSAFGIYFTREILMTYFSPEEKKESKFCSIGEDFSCDSIIKSKSYTFSKYFEFVDLPVLFFTSTFISLLIGLDIGYTIGVISLFSIPLLGYSIYLQKFVLKKWCVLCLTIAGLLLVNGLLFFVFYPSLVFTLSVNIKLLIITLLTLFGWLKLKKRLIKLNEAESELKVLLRFKRTDEVFYKTNDAVNNFEIIESLEMMVFGNEAATNHLILFISPSCPHCHTAYKDAMELLKKYPENLKLSIGYNLNLGNQDNPYLEIARRIFNMHAQNEDVFAALNDWHIENLDMAIWKKKWGTDSNVLEMENHKISKQFEWCVMNDFNYAPVKVFNGRLLGHQYTINELFYFFRE